MRRDGVHPTLKVLLGAAVVAAGPTCSRSHPLARPAVSAAVALVSRFVAADMNGSADSAMVLLRGCDVKPSADFLEPTLEARTLGATLADSAVRVAVRYVVVGKLMDSGLREIRWRLAPTVRADTVIFAVVEDSTGRLWIDCGYYPPNHPDVSRMAHIVAEMDAATRAEWDSALAAARRLQ